MFKQASSESHVGGIKEKFCSRHLLKTAGQISLAIAVGERNFSIELSSTQDTADRWGSIANKQSEGSEWRITIRNYF